MTAYRKNQGFTLVEILIVVIILGILAAIVIPQFTNASNDARVSSIQSQLQTLRSQVELYKLQHKEGWPTATGLIDGAWAWDKLTTKTEQDSAGTAGNASGDEVGPYLQQVPVNPLNNSSAMTTVAADPADGAAAAGGFVFSQATGKIFATDKDGNVNTAW